MLSIDGSSLEGGGQIIRSAVALSAVTGIPVEIIRIREKRSKPGLAHQHCAAVRAVAGACRGTVTGNLPGSHSLTFSPGDIVRQDLSVDVGTAGSIPLVIQAWLPVALVKGGSLTISGGTEVPFSPTIDYITEVFLPALGEAGRGITIDIMRRGYYPGGGGRVRITAESIPPSPIRIGRTGSSGIRSCSTNLPFHVAERQAASAQAFLAGKTGEVYPVSIQRSEGPGPGSSCTVWKGSQGSCAIGKRGLPAEDVGMMAASGLITGIEQGGDVDLHLSDQLLFYLARAGGSYTAFRFTLHAKTLCWLLSLFGMPLEIRETGMVEFSA